MKSNELVRCWGRSFDAENSGYKGDYAEIRVEGRKDIFVANLGFE